MKKMILAATILAMAGASLQTAKAGDREWATAGKILTGVVAGAVIANALDSHRHSYSVSYHSAPTYCPPPSVVYAPAPVVYVPPRPRVIYAPAPVVCAPSPVVVYRTPVCVAPQPVVSVNFGYHGSHRHGWGRHHQR